jgi:hypothetical protein
MGRIPNSTAAVMTTGLFMPIDFPTGAYQAIHLKIAPHATNNKPVYDQFAGAWNAITHRYKAFAECDDLFSESISKYGAGPPAEERYRQERDLFAFFSNGFSTFEAFFYGAFAAGSILQPKQFPIATPQDQRRITAANTITAYRAAFPSAPFVGALDAVITDHAYMEMREIRNVLSHRSAPGRTMHVAIGAEPAPDQWKLENIVLDNKTTATRRDRACQVLSPAMKAFQKFSDAQF